MRGLIYGAGSQMSTGVQKMYLEILACLRRQIKKMRSISFSALLASHRNASSKGARRHTNEYWPSSVKHSSQKAWHTYH